MIHPPDSGFRLPWALSGAALVLTWAALLLPSFASGAEPPPTEAEIGSEQVYLSPAEALVEIFGEVATVDTLVRILDPEILQALHESLGAPAPSDTAVIYRIRDAEGKEIGLAVIAEEAGKYRPFEFMVGITPRREVRGVEVLVYRESRGGEIRKSRFLRQYRGKSAQDPIRTNRDILNVAGATISVNALNHGVRRVLRNLALLENRGSL